MRKSELEKKVKELEEQLVEAQLEALATNIAIEGTLEMANDLINTKQWQYSALGMCIGGILTALLYLIFG